MQKIFSEMGDNLVRFGIKLLLAILIIVVGFKLVNFFMKRIKKGKGFLRIEKSSQTFISSVLTLILKIIVLFTAIAELGIPTSTIIAVVGSAGLALGLALQGGLSNIAGGVMIMIFKPFKVGDFVDTHADSGIVKEINIFHTVLNTYDNRLVVIPNGTLSNSTIVNYSSMKSRLLDVTVTVDYKSDIDEVKQVLREVAKKCKYRLPNEEILVALKEHGESALVFTTRVWVASDDYWTAKFDILENIKKALDEAKINIPYPQLDVHFDK